LTEEKEAERFLQSGDYEKAVVYYTRALAANNSRRREERILYKLGLSCRNAGEKERSLDFFMRLLSLNPDSSYRSGIQNILRSDADGESGFARPEDLYRPYTPEEVVVPQGMTLVQAKSERDNLYRALVGELLQINNGKISHRSLDLWRNLRKMQLEYEKLIKEGLDVRVAELRRIETRNIYFIGLPEEMGKSLSSSEKVFHLSISHFETVFDALNAGDPGFSPDGVFLNIADLSEERLRISVERFLDFYKNAKLFLIFVDNQTAVDTSLVSSFPEDRVRFLSVAEIGEDLRHSIGEILHVRSLWH
jgi:tetratricopeptide (TPR) repeat protein